MSTIDQHQVKHTAHLSRLELAPEELEQMTVEMTHILDYVKKLETLDVSQVEPSIFAIDLQNVYQKDEVQRSLSREEALQNAPQTDQFHFLVPKVIEEERE